MSRHLFSMVVAALAFALACLPARAGMIVCNDTGQEVSLAIGWSAGSAWNSSGSYNIKSRDCALPLKGALTNRYVYFYAEAGSVKWEGGNNSAWFCANHKDKFDYSFEVDPPCDGYRFRRIDVGNSQQYTLNLTENRADPKDAAINCSSQISKGRDEFVSCWIRQMATAKQRKILDCMRQTDTAASMAVCASKNYISGDAAKVADCSLKYSENKSTVAFARCIANGQIGEQEAKISRLRHQEPR